MYRRLIVVCLWSLLGLPAVAQAQWLYTTNSGGITITGYTGPGGAVTIPSTLESLTVTNIGSTAFQGATNLTSVVIPNTVMSIMDYVFFDCPNLTSVALPTSVTLVYPHAFNNCPNLTVTIYGSGTSVPNGLFYQNGCLDGTVGLSSVIISNGVIGLEDGAFYQCCNLISVVIPTSVTGVGDYAFFGCPNLTSVALPTSVRLVHPHAFNNSPNLTVTIYGSGTSVPNGLFYQNGCLDGTVGLSSVIISNGVTGVEDGAFYQCCNLISVALPTSVRLVYPYAFNNSPNLTVTIYGSGTSVPNGLFYQNGCLDGTVGLSSVIISNGVIGVEGGVFYQCCNLTSVALPASVSSIGDYAFSYCPNLVSVDFQGNAPSTVSTAFSGATNATAYYLPGTTGWGPMIGAIPAVMLVPPQLLLSVRTNGWNLAFVTPTNHLYGVQSTTNLVGGVWSTVVSNIPGTGLPTNYVDTTVPVPQKFYRVRVRF
ncbi:MAG TPA: leucine-rich repeat domain-containing protein [Verrucomicrobiae bacterium]|nr:leucine-rich repeat domain-containing protein [Verrucomicrobiae bacterium]